MLARSSREVCRQVSGVIKEQLTWISGRTPKRGFSGSSSGRSIIFPRSKESIIVNVARGINDRGCNEGRNLRVAEVLMVRRVEELGGLRRMSFTSRPAEGPSQTDDSAVKTEGSHSDEYLELAKKKQGVGAVAGESLAAVDTEFIEKNDNECADTQHEAGAEFVSFEPRHPARPKQDEADVHPESDNGLHPDPNGEHCPSVDEEVKRGLVADSEVPYGHERESR